MQQKREKKTPQGGNRADGNSGLPTRNTSSRESLSLVDAQVAEGPKRSIGKVSLKELTHTIATGIWCLPSCSPCAG